VLILEIRKKEQLLFVVLLAWWLDVVSIVVIAENGDRHDPLQCCPDKFDWFTVSDSF